MQNKQVRDMIVDCVQSKTVHAQTENSQSSRQAFQSHRQRQNYAPQSFQESLVAAQERNPQAQSVQDGSRGRTRRRERAFDAAIFVEDKETKP